MTLIEQVVHVFKKDLWRFWPALIGFGALMVAHVTTGIPTPGSLSGFRLPIQAGVFQLLLAAFAVAVVQEDGVANDRAFWATRPLSGHALLTAKVAFIGIFLVVAPVALHVNWLQRLGGGGPMWGLMADSLLYHGGLIAMVALGAATTNTMRSFLVVALSAWIVLLALGAAFASDVVDWSGGRRTTDDYLMHWSWLVVGGGLLIYQYLARRTLRTYVLGAMVFAVGVPLIQRSDADWSVDPDAPTARFDYEQADDIQLSLRHLSRDQNQNGAAVGRDAIQAQVSLVEQLGVLLIPTGIASRLTGGGIDRTFEFEPRLDPFLTSPALVTGGLPGMRRLGGGRGALGINEGFAVMIVDATPDELDGPLRRADRLEITLSLDVFRPRVIGTVPLKVGASASTSSGRFQVESVRRVQRGVTLEYSFQRASRALAPTRGLFRETVVPLLYNRHRGEYLDQGGGGGGGDFAAPLVGGAKLVVRNRRTDFNTGFVRNPDEVPEDWFDHVEILIVGREYVGSLTRTILRDIEEWPDYGPPVNVDARRGR